MSVEAHVKTFDIIVIGSGVAGSATAYAAAGRHRVLLLEQFPFLHANGSSHGGSRIFRHAYEDVRYVRLARSAEEGWRRLERDAGDSLLRTTGGVDIAPLDDTSLDLIEGALREAGSPVERVGANELAERYPAIRVDQDHEALVQATAGVLAADRAVLAMLRTASSRGAELHEREPVLELAAREDAVTVSTAQGRYEAASVVVCAGPWLGNLLPAYADALTIERQQVLYLPVSPTSSFDASTFPIFIHRTAGVYGFPLFERPTSIKVSNHTGAPAIRLADRTFDLDEASAVDTVRRVRRFLPDVGGRWTEFQTCLYTKTPDEDFILGKHPSMPGVVLGGGFSGHGFKFGPLLGEILADLATGAEGGHDISLFAPDRDALLGGPGAVGSAAPGRSSGGAIDASGRGEDQGTQHRRIRR